MKILRAAILAIFLLAPACAIYCADAPQAAVQVDAEIPADTLATIHGINDTLFQSMKDDKPSVMMNMFVSEGRNDKNLEANVMDTYKKLGDLAKGTTFSVLHEYLIDAKGSGTVAVTVLGDGENRFIIGVEAGKGPLVLSLLSSNGNLKDPILCFGYIKTQDGWQLYTFHSGIYKVAGKTAIGWYQDAKKMYDAGWDVPAMLWMQLVESFVRPAPFIQYENEKEIQAFFKEGAAETSKKYRFPFKATWVKDMPMIYGLDTQFDKGVLVPVVVYVTKYNLNLGMSMQEEVDAITSKLDKIIPGITKCGFGEVAYRAFSEPPLDESKDYKYRSISSRAK